MAFAYANANLSRVEAVEDGRKVGQRIPSPVSLTARITRIAIRLQSDQPPRSALCSQSQFAAIGNDLGNRKSEWHKATPARSSMKRTPRFRANGVRLSISRACGLCGGLLRVLDQSLPHRTRKYEKRFRKTPHFPARCQRHPVDGLTIHSAHFRGSRHVVCVSEIITQEACATRAPRRR